MNTKSWWLGALARFVPTIAALGGIVFSKDRLLWDLLFGMSLLSDLMYLGGRWGVFASIERFAHMPVTLCLLMVIQREHAADRSEQAAAYILGALLAVVAVLRVLRGLLVAETIWRDVFQETWQLSWTKPCTKPRFRILSVAYVLAQYCNALVWFLWDGKLLVKRAPEV